MILYEVAMPWLLRGVVWQECMLKAVQCSTTVLPTRASLLATLRLVAAPAGATYCMNM